MRNPQIVTRNFSLKLSLKKRFNLQNSVSVLCAVIPCMTLRKKNASPSYSDNYIFCNFFPREQVDREQALDDFKTGRAKILIATDVASRGLDIRGVT